MLPQKPMIDSPDEAVRYVEPTPYIGLRNTPLQKRNYFDNLILGKPVHPMFLAMRMTLLTLCIAMVILVGPREQMCRMEARWPVATMECSGCCWNRLPSNNLDHNSCDAELPVANVYNPVSPRCFPSGPIQAFIGVPWESRIVMQSRERCFQMLVTGIMLAHLRGSFHRALHWVVAVYAARPFTILAQPETC